MNDIEKLLDEARRSMIAGDAEAALRLLMDAKAQDAADALLFSNSEADTALGERVVSCFIDALAGASDEATFRSVLQWVCSVALVSEAGQLFARRVYLLAYHVFVGRSVGDATQGLLRRLHETPLVMAALTQVERTLLQGSLNRALHLGPPTGDLVDFAELPKPPTWP
ncbi:MAG: hypothetical protein AB1725_01870 [Armatimonadota bacterium]